MGGWRRGCDGEKERASGGTDGDGVEETDGMRVEQEEEEEETEAQLSHGTEEVRVLIPLSPSLPLSLCPALPLSLSLTPWCLSS